MALIAANTHIHAELAVVVAAVTTIDGFRQWLTDDADVGRGVGARAIFRFGAIEVSFLIDRVDSHGIEMTCVDHRNYPEWLDTHVAIRVTPDSGGAYVDLLHDGYRDRSHCYVESLERWKESISSLRAYCETWRGIPHAPTILHTKG